MFNEQLGSALYSTPSNQEHTRAPIELVDLSEFTENPELFQDDKLIIQLKGFNGSDRRARRIKQVMQGQSGSSEARPISPGAVYVFDKLGTASLLETVPHPHTYDTADSRGMAFAGENIFVGCIDHVEVIDKKTWEMKPFTIESKWLGFIHSLAISPDGKRMAIVSSGFDRIIEVDLSTGEVAREWIAWNNGYDSSRQDGTKIITEKKLHEEVVAAGGKSLYVDSPEPFSSGLGLPPNLRTAFPNSTLYIDQNTLLATLYHFGLVKIDLNSGETKVLDDQLNNPHAVYKTESGYMVTNSSKGQAIFYDENFNRVKILDFTHMKGLLTGANGGEWLQHVNPLGDGKFMAVDSNRAAIVFIDENTQSYRSVAMPEDWVVQEAHILDN